MRFLGFISVLSLLFSIISCGSEAGSDFLPAPFVQEVVSDRFSRGYSVLSSYRYPVRNADISIAGPLDRSRSFAQTLISFDAHDNVSGSAATDGLPDFSGEKFLLLASETDGFLSDSLVGIGISQMICALDTVYHISPYDLDGLGHKRRSKILIFSDPLHCVHFKKNVGYIKSFFNSDIPVIFPSELTVRSCLDKISSENVNVAFICDSTNVSDSDYGRILADVASESGKTVNSFFSFKLPDDCEDPFISFMDAYIASGNSCPLDAVIVDSYSADVREIRESSRNIRSVLSPESLIYGKYLPENLEVEGVYETTAEYCFRLMRKLNLFTHNITLPYSESFNTIHHPDSSVRSYILVPYVI